MPPSFRKISRQLFPWAVPILLLLALPGVCSAGEADVLDVKVTRAVDGTYTFTVTVAHQDEGWDHYADRWDIVGPDGKVIATRILLHPHIGEQPFTRSKAGVVIQEEVKLVTVRAGDSVHGYGGEEISVQLAGRVPE